MCLILWEASRLSFQYLYHLLFHELCVNLLTAQLLPQHLVLTVGVLDVSILRSLHWVLSCIIVQMHFRVS